MGSSRQTSLLDKEKRLSAEDVGFLTPFPASSPTASHSTGSKKGTSLDTYTTKLAVCTGSKRKRKKYKIWGKKEKRAFQRSLSGIKVAEILDKKLRFLTLTTASWAYRRDINHDFELLKKRIRRKYGCFEYFKIKTNEGYGVLHILYRGSYISQKWLRKSWSEVHGGSYIVDVRLVRMRKKHLARYLVTQYVVGQCFTRMSWSWKWVFKAFVRVWRSVVYRNRGDFKKILREWECLLYQHCYKQKLIYDYLSEKPPPDWRCVTDDWWRKSNKSCVLK